MRFEQGSLEFSLTPGASPTLAQQLMRRLQEWTGIRWMVAISREEGAPTLREVQDAQEAERMTGVRAIPLVRSVLDHFPGAEIVAVRSPEPEVPPVSPAIVAETADASEDIGYVDDMIIEDDL